MEEILRRLDQLENTLNRRHDELDAKVDDCRLAIVTTQGEMKRVEQKVDMHAAGQSREHGAVQERVGALEKSVGQISTTQAGMKAKLTVLGALIGGAASEALRRLLGHQG